MLNHPGAPGVLPDPQNPAGLRRDGERRSPFPFLPMMAACFHDDSLPHTLKRPE